MVLVMFMSVYFKIRSYLYGIYGNCFLPCSLYRWIAVHCTVYSDKSGVWYPGDWTIKSYVIWNIYYAQLSPAIYIYIYSLYSCLECLYKHWNLVFLKMFIGYKNRMSEVMVVLFLHTSTLTFSVDVVVSTGVHLLVYRST